MHYSILGKGLLYLLISLLVLSCNSKNSNTDQGDRVPLSALKLTVAQDCQQLKSYIRESLIKQYTDENQYAYCGGGIGGGVPLPSPANTDTTAFESSAAPTGVSQTNTQEVGVGESDTIKSDQNGNVFMIRGNQLMLADAFPPQNMQLVDTINLPAQALGIYLHEGTTPNENRLMVITQQYGYYALPALDSLTFAPPQDQVMELVIHFYQLTYDNQGNIQGAQQINTLKMDGNYQDSREIDGRLHIVSRYYLRPRILLEADAELNRLRSELSLAVNEQRCTNVDKTAEITDLKEQIGIRITNLVDAVNVEELLPKVYQNGNLASGFLSCGDVHFPQAQFNYGLQVITSVDSDGQNAAATATVNNAWITYASRENMYMAQPSYGWWWSDRQASQTAIYKFKLGAGKPLYLATGSIDGRTLNQFSLSEYQGALRVASTVDARRWVFNDPNVPVTTSTNHLHVLQQVGTELRVSGSVRNIAPGEVIRSARFLQDKGFIVTFRNIDPLFAFDLKDPNNPLLLGELKIPGFSSYMHPMNDQYLITIGREGNQNNTGIGTDFQLQLIDISDLRNPRVHKRYTPPDLGSYSWSAAEYDHKAFTYYAPRRLLAIPASIYTRTNTSFNGILVFRVDPDVGSTEQGGFVELGRVDHKDLAYETYCGPNTSYTPCADYGYIYWASPRRTVIMTGNQNQQLQEYLFTMSEVGLKASDVRDVNTALSSILFPAYPQPPIILY